MHFCVKNRTYDCFCQQSALLTLYLYEGNPQMSSVTRRSLLYRAGQPANVSISWQVIRMNYFTIRVNVIYLCCDWLKPYRDMIKLCRAQCVEFWHNGQPYMWSTFPAAHLALTFPNWWLTFLFRHGWRHHEHNRRLHSLLHLQIVERLHSGTGNAHMFSVISAKRTTNLFHMEIDLIWWSLTARGDVNYISNGITAWINTWVGCIHTPKQ